MLRGALQWTLPRWRTTLRPSDDATFEVHRKQQHRQQLRSREPSIEGISASAEGEPEHGGLTRDTSMSSLDYHDGLHPPRITTLKLQDQSNWITSCTASDSETLLAVSSVSSDKNIYIVYNEPSDDGSHLQGRYVVTGTFACPNAIYDLDWQHEHILAGGAAGALYLLHARHDKLKNKNTSLDGLDCVAQFLTSTSEHAASGSMEDPVLEDAQPRITKCSRSPRNDKMQFASLLAGSAVARVWDATQPAEPVSQYGNLTGREHSSLSCLQWSPHADGNKSLIAVGTSSGDLVIIDTRESGSSAKAWSRSKVHHGEVSAAKWNPFIPYWVASAGHDAVIKIWDLRFSTREMVNIEPGHSHAISALTWSQTHVDVIASASLDRTCNVIHLSARQPSMHNVVAETSLTGSAGGFASLVSSPVVHNKRAPVMFYGVSSFGELQAIELPRATVEAIGVYESNSMLDPDKYKVEKRLQTRDIATARSLAKDLGFPRKMCFPRPAIKSDSWSIPKPEPTITELSASSSALPLPTMTDVADHGQVVEQFWKEFAEAAKGLPPNYSDTSRRRSVSNPLRYSWDGELASQNAISLASPEEARNELLQILRSKDPASAVIMIPAILSSLRMSAGAFRIDELKNFTLFLLKHAYIDGLRFGVDIAEIYLSRQYDFQQLHDLIHWLLFPTAYDLDDKIDKERRQAITNAAQGQRAISKKDSRLDLASDLSMANDSRAMESTDDAKEKYTSLKKRVRAAHETVLVDSALVLPMLRLEIRVQETILENSAVMPDKIMQMCRYQRTVSVTTNRTYLHCLMQRSEYEELLYVATELVNTYMTYDFGIQVARLLRDQVFPKMEAELLSVARKVKANPDFEYLAADKSVRIPEKFRGWVLMIGRINKLCPVVLLRELNSHATGKEVYRITHEMNVLPRYIPGELAKKMGLSVPPPSYVMYLRKLQESAAYGLPGQSYYAQPAAT
ncbi:hypothetical protein RI367_002832 [Sorochytrium milnesiophthora]